MIGATHQIRTQVVDELMQIYSVSAAHEGDTVRVINETEEQALGGILERLADAVQVDVTTSSILRAGDPEVLSEEQAFGLFGAVDQWASVASYAVASLYAPQSPLPRGLAGWASKIGEILQRIASILIFPLQVVARALGASSWSIGASFPWGISVSLNWP
jgi:hypothetical protein